MKKKATREDALRIARYMGCTGAHQGEDGSWMPCADHATLTRISNRAETQMVAEKSDTDIVLSPSGRKRKRPKTGQGMWQNFRQRRPLGIQALGDGGLVNTPTPYRTQPMGDSPANGGSAGAVITLSDDDETEIKGGTVLNPSVNDPDVFRSPSSARMRATQLGCTGIRRYRSAEGETVWMPCTTGVTYDRQQGYGAYRNDLPRPQEQRIQQVVQREVRRALRTNQSKKSARRLAATPAKPSERISGSDKNPKGSASSTRKASGISLSPQQEKALIVKAREHNAKMREAGKPSWSLTSSATLKAVMRRGMGAFSQSHRPDVSSRQQWGMGRVNAFLKMLETGRPKNTKYTTDNDLLREGHPWKSKGIKHQIERIEVKAQPRDADGDGRIYDGTARERFVGARRAAEGINRVFSRSRRNQRSKPVRVVLDPKIGKPNSRSAMRRLIQDANNTVVGLSREGRTKRKFRGRQVASQRKVKGLTFKEAMRRTPQRQSRTLAVATQRSFPHAPKVDTKPMVTMESLRKPDGSFSTTSTHFVKDGTYTPERQELHRKIIDSILYGGDKKIQPKAQKEPKVWVFGGGPASGKTYLRQAGWFTNPPRGEEAVHIDADEIKMMIPEFSAMVKEAQEKGLDSSSVSSIVHSESTYIAALAAQEAVANNFHVALDSTGDGGPVRMAERLKPFIDAGYKMDGAYATVSMEFAQERAEERLKETARGVPPKVLMETHADVSRAVLYALQNNLFDNFELVNNENHSAPVVIVSAKDGVVVVHNPTLWEEFVAKARIDIKEEDPYDWFDDAFPGIDRTKKKAANEAEGESQDLVLNTSKIVVPTDEPTGLNPEQRAQVLIALALNSKPKIDGVEQSVMDAYADSLKSEIEELRKAKVNITVPNSLVDSLTSDISSSAE